MELIAPVIHQQAMERLATVTGLTPVEFPTTREPDASPIERARDLNAAFADPEIRAVLTTVGGEDEIGADSKPFLGHSDNSNVLKQIELFEPGAFRGLRPRLERRSRSR